eukprot:2503141-Ditylum_brightwellii.AAC.1
MVGWGDRIKLPPLPPLCDTDKIRDDDKMLGMAVCGDSIGLSPPPPLHNAPPCLPTSLLHLSLLCNLLHPPLPPPPQLKHRSNPADSDSETDGESKSFSTHPTSSKSDSENMGEMVGCGGECNNVGDGNESNHNNSDESDVETDGKT